jgi:S1-C subfamily serine protease
MALTERRARWRHATAGLNLRLILQLLPSAAWSHLTGGPTVPDVVQRVIPAVVSITTRHISRDDPEQTMSARGMGSGVIVDRRGHILTNHHIVEDAETIKVTLTDERTFRATWNNIKGVAFTRTSEQRRESCRMRP